MSMHVKTHTYCAYIGICIHRLGYDEHLCTRMSMPVYDVHMNCAYGCALRMLRVAAQGTHRAESSEA